MTTISSTLSTSSLLPLTKEDLEMQKFTKKLAEIEAKAELEAKDAKVVEMKKLKDKLTSLQTQLSRTTDTEKKDKLLSAIAGVCGQINRLMIEMSMG